MSQDKEVANEIRIGITSKPKDIISKCEKLLKEDKVKDLHLSAVGNSIGELVIYVEILKSIFPKLSQKSVFSTITPTPSKKEKKTGVRVHFVEAQAAQDCEASRCSVR